ncbi:MAG: penicillin acylase family protein [Sphingobacterium sp.]|jgi:penicillin amidase|uniref:penicillin acylase family protein n=1 Tax=Sphingobacterium sp. TaxID=341027 RepID=UPI002845C7FB|nr:penicillin acylase family protein [Sphingobacterium sp.]MDR3010883.1 penicillin acylase family protein [Sphingobacterium sp.]
MKKFNPDSLFASLVLFTLIYAISNSIFGIPPIGKVLNPFIGVVQNSSNDCLDMNLVDTKCNTRDSVEILIDKRKVPHIFAKNTHDLYFSQGYVTARLRLWQMDFFSYLAAGRLSEIIDNPVLLKQDRTQRRTGIVDAARKTLAFIKKDKEIWDILSSYTEGINAYIDQLNYKNMPLEYKILNYSPERWTNLKSVLILKLFSSTLSGYETDVYMSKLMLALGEKDFNLLFPEYINVFSPLIPKKEEQIRTNKFVHKPDYLNYNFLTSFNKPTFNDYNPKLGSNSWVVAASLTKSGYPILANDPHLELSLPCFWLEMQLKAPDINTYGVSIPGAPSIIIGYNDKISWGITNGADDNKDWYKLQINESKKEYLFDGEWKKLKVRLDTIKQRNGLVLIDTIYESIHGPIVYDRNFTADHIELSGYALKWGLHEPSNEFRSFVMVNRALNYNEFKSAISGFGTPILNFTFASDDGTIGAIHQGKIPKKMDGQGRFLMDGTISSLIPKQFIEQDDLPNIINPKKGYIVSANQHPTDEDYKYYYNGYYSEERANRINEILNGAINYSVEDAMKMQLDNVVFSAKHSICALIGMVDLEKIDERHRFLLNKLSNWDGSYSSEDKYAKLFDLWLSKIELSTWEEFKQYPFFAGYPSRGVLLNLIQEDQDNKFFDNIFTNERENARDIITISFREAVTEYKSLNAEGNISWGNLNKVDVLHMTKLPAFSKKGIELSGNPNSINAMSKNWGPSWRMIVEMGPSKKAYGIYPGGQSGNIGSKYYDNFLDDWQTGKFYELFLFKSKEEARKEATNNWLLL